jgi:phage protein D/phage baseplate assembly protein gpV
MKSAGALPQIRITVDGANASAHLAGALAHVRVQQRLSLPTLCELTFSARGSAIDDTPVIGARLEIRVDDDALLFAGDVTAIEHSFRPATGRLVRVRAYDELHRLRASQPVVAHTQFTPASLARELASQHELDVIADEEGRAIARWVQHRQNDLEFLTEVCARAGLSFFVADGALRLFRLQESADVVELQLGDTLLEARIETNAASLTKSVTTKGWNPQLVAAHEARVQREETSDALQPALERATERSIVDELFTDDGEAEDVAAAELARRNHALVSVWGIAEGSVELRPGATVSIRGLADEEQQCVLTSVDHTIERSSGFRSEITNALPQAPSRERAAITAVGIVARVDDPENLGRIKLTLPSFCDVETEWLPVVTAGAGAAKGFIAIPDVDDVVIAIFPRGEPGLGFVIGSLFRNGHPDPGVDGGRVRRYSFLTPGGQKLQFDDIRDSMRLENKQGSWFELTPEQLLVHAASDLAIEAPGRTITIRGNAINFERG